MKKAWWKKRITEATKEAGTYQPYFDSVIGTLAEILERRDDAQELYEQTGSKPIISHTNKGGATNLVQNPALRLINDLNRDALAYWRDLGLTPAGYKKLDVKEKDSGSFEKLLSKIME